MSAPAGGLWSALRRDPGALAAAALLSLLLLLILLGPLLSPYAVDSIDFDADWEQPPQWLGRHWFGTDGLGRDVFVRSLEGGRVSLLVGIAATAVSLLIGVAYGAIAGYYGGRLDELMMRAVDILYALPFLFLVILLMVLFGREFWLVFVAIGAINWLDMARIVRGETLALKQREFVLAARASGLGDFAILWGQILPNLLGTVAVVATLTVPQVILTESFLSFLGLGVQEPATSWGALVNDGAREMERTPWTLLFPAGLLALTLLCLNRLGDALSDALDRGAD
jgi:oligopeptide transport system permease protein